MENYGPESYSGLFDEFLEETTDIEPANFDIGYPSPSFNYYTFKKTISNVPSPSATVQRAPATKSTSSENLLSNLDFLSDSFEEIDNVTLTEIDKIVHLAEMSMESNNNIQISQRSTTFCGRFVQSDENQRQEFLNQNENKNTHRKMMTTIKTFRNFLLNIKTENREPQNIPPIQLDQYLQEFFIGIRKETKDPSANENESQYQPGSLDGFQSMVNRYLRLNNYGHDIVTDQLFAKSRECLRAKKKNLKQLGFGNRPNAAEALDSEEEEELFACGAFGTDNPDSLISALWYMNTIHFGLRGSHEHRQLKWGDVILETDTSGEQRLIYNERLTKTRDGTNTRNTRAYAPKSWANETNEKKCHINMYLKYLGQRPAEMMDPESPFYLGVNRNENAKLWYKGQPMGETKLNSLMKCAIKKTNIDKNKKITNHSGRKTAISRLLDNGVTLTSVQQHSGHKSMASLYNYSKNSMKQQKNISSILNRSTPISEMSNASNSNPSTHVTPISKTNRNTENVLNTCTFNIPSTTKSTNTNFTDLTNQPQIVSAMQTTGMNFADVFPKGTIIQGGTFNFNFNIETVHGKENVGPRRKRKFVIDSDSD